MYPVAIMGESLSCQFMALAARASGFTQLSRYAVAQAPSATPALYSFGANASRLLRALAPDTLEALGFQPDRYQVRFSQSAYLLAELPLGEFYQQRYGSPLVNVAADKLHAELERILNTTVQPARDLAAVESEHQLTVLGETQRADTADSVPAPFKVFHATLPEHPLRRANVLWRGPGQYIEQLADGENVHFRMVTRAHQDFTEAEWHHSLHPALAAKIEIGSIDPQAFQPRDTLFGGRVAFLSDTQTCLPSKIDAANTGMEDAWVLSRMMENYEEDVSDGLAAFERFRRPRQRKVALQMRSQLKSLTETSTRKRVQQHVATALRNRLLPEIALQQQDWLYEHDVIKGFR